MAARTARLPEWWNVPSPMFCSRCLRVRRNGSIPIHCAPSPPIWVSPVTSPTASGSIISTSAWQPMPPPTIEPAGALVELLCGQPEQKYGVRATSGSCVTVRGFAVRARQVSTVGNRGPLSRSARPRAMRSASSSPSGGNSGSPAWPRPLTRGASGRP